VYYDPDGKPTKELIGMDIVCDKWSIGVLVNRHFKNEMQWKYSDVEFYDDGFFRYCARWRRVPRFRDLYFPGLPWSPNSNGKGQGSGPNANGANGTNGTGSTQPGAGTNGAPGSTPGPGPVTPPTLNVHKTKIEVPCSNEVNVVLNDRNLEVGRDTKDALGRKCTIWVRTEEVPENFKQHQDNMNDKNKNPSS
jgi:hypothetical protein